MLKVVILFKNTPSRLHHIHQRRGLYISYIDFCIYIYIYIYIYENIRIFWHIKTLHSWISWILGLKCAYTWCITNTPRSKCVDFLVRSTYNGSVKTFLHKTFSWRLGIFQNTFENCVNFSCLIFEPKLF